LFRYKIYPVTFGDIFYYFSKRHKNELGVIVIIDVTRQTLLLTDFALRA